MPDFLPISMTTIHEAEPTCLIVEGQMLRDFGPWKCGETKCLTFNFVEGHVTEYQDDGGIILRLALSLRIMGTLSSWAIQQTLCKK